MPHPFAATYSKCLTRLVSLHHTAHAELDSTSRVITSGTLIGSGHEHFDRALNIASLRVLHICRQVAQAYSEQFQQRYHRFHPGLAKDPKKALEYKYLHVLVGIYRTCSERSIPLRHWFRAQFETLSKMDCVYIATCSGPNALKRYEDWAARQTSRFKDREDRNAALNTSLYTVIEASILDSHLMALKHWEHYKTFDPPCLGAMFLALYPQVSAWYLVAQESVRELLDAGLWTDATVMKRLKQFKSNPRVRASCQMGLDAAVENHGRLEL